MRCKFNQSVPALTRPAPACPAVMGPYHPARIRLTWTADHAPNCVMLTLFALSIFNLSISELFTLAEDPAKRRGYDMTNNLLSIAPPEKSTRRGSPPAFLVEELFLLEESMNENALGCVRWILWAVVIEVLISIAALVAWFRFRSPPASGSVGCALSGRGPKDCPLPAARA
jgi:hypothetical protein